MSRPEPKILVEQEQDDSTVWQAIGCLQTYVITYKGQPIDIRVVQPELGYVKFKYKRTSYNQIGTARAQVRRYNKMFNTTDFDYIIV